jgi:hypothetical protein
VSPIVVPNGMSDEQALFLGAIFPTGWLLQKMQDVQRSWPQST